jgi:indolepyruvate ferredoxin oxidoreductase beta subunit
MDEKTDFLFVGVGGQGIILASDVLADVGIAAGYDVRKSEIHGMSQRGGSVDSFVRWGRDLASPIAERGAVDILVGFELLEAARWADYVARGGTAILNRQRIPPLAVAGGECAYPSDEEIAGLYCARGASVQMVNALDKAKELGNPNAVSVVLLGVLSLALEVPTGQWLESIAGRVPVRFRDLNERAFWSGRALTVEVRDVGLSAAGGNLGGK